MKKFTFSATLAEYESGKKSEAYKQYEAFLSACKQKNTRASVSAETQVNL